MRKATLEDVFLELTGSGGTTSDHERTAAAHRDQPAVALPEPDGAALRLSVPGHLSLAFYVLYRYEKVPLARHMGELLTVTILGGACFGLPTTMVSERERGVWRRYRLAPVATGGAGRQHGRRAVRERLSPPGCCRWRSRCARDAAAATPARAVGGVHVRDVRVHRTRAGDRDARRQRAGRAGARPVHLPADADHRRRGGPAVEPARLGAARLGVLSGTIRGRGMQACVTGDGLGRCASACSR